MAIKYGELKEQTAPISTRPILFCVNCHGEYSANKSDYFSRDPGETASCCGEPLRLVVKRRAGISTGLAR